MAESRPTSDTAHVFVGRQQEMAVLETALRDAPRPTGHAGGRAGYREDPYRPGAGIDMQVWGNKLGANKNWKSKWGIPGKLPMAFEDTHHGTLL